MDDDTAKYTIRRSETGLGVEYTFHGPGMPQYANGAHFLQALSDSAASYLESGKDRVNHTESEALRVRGLLAAAYQAGFEAAKKELRAWLQVPSRKWGDPF